MAEERKVSVDLEVTKSGETGAFKETAGEVRELKEEAAGAAPELEDLGDAASNAGDAAGDAGKNIGDMGDAAADTKGKLANVAVQAAAVAAAFTTGYEIGTKLRGIFNDLTNGGLDRQLQQDATSLINFFTSLDETGDAALRLQNGMNILKKNGIDPVGLSAEEVAKKIEELSSSKRDAAAAAQELIEAEEEWAVKLGLSGKALDESSKKLATYIADFAKQNDQLSKTDLAKIFGPMIQDVLDSYERLGKEAPPEVKKLADGWGVLTTSAKKAADDQKKIVDEMVADITGAAAGLKGNLEAQLKTLNEVFSKIDFGKLGADQIDEAKGFLQEFIDTSRKAGQQIPKDVADQAAALGILVNAMEVASEANTGLRGTEAELQQVVIGTSQTFNSQGQELSRLSTITNQAGAAAKVGGAQMKEGADLAGEGAESMSALTGEAKRVLDTMVAAGKASKTAGTDAKLGADTAGEGAEALEKVGAAGEVAGEGMGAVKTAAEGLGPAATAAKTGVEGLKTSLDGIEAKAGVAATGLQELNKVDLKALDSSLASVIAKLDQVAAKAAAAKAALDQIDEGD